MSGGLPSGQEPLSLWEWLGLLLVVLAVVIGGAAVAGAVLAVAAWACRGLS